VFKFECKREKDIYVNIYVILKNVGPLVLNRREWEVKSKHMKVDLQKSRTCF
jgi:hypothetical protein